MLPHTYNPFNLSWHVSGPSSRIWSRTRLISDSFKLFLVRPYLLFFGKESTWLSLKQALSPPATPACPSKDEDLAGPVELFGCWWVSCWSVTITVLRLEAVKRPCSFLHGSPLCSMLWYMNCLGSLQVNHWVACVGIWDVNIGIVLLRMGIIRALGKRHNICVSLTIKGKPGGSCLPQIPSPVACALFTTPAFYLLLSF